MITSPEEHNRRKALYEEGLTDSELAEACFICVNAIRYWRESFDPKLPPNSKKSIHLEARLVLYSSGLTDIEIARQQQCSRMAIRDWRKKRGLPQNPRGKVENNCANS